jgi:hypothetical protein
MPATFFLQFRELSYQLGSRGYICDENVAGCHFVSQKSERASVLLFKVMSFLTIHMQKLRGYVAEKSMVGELPTFVSHVEASKGARHLISDACVDFCSCQPRKPLSATCFVRLIQMVALPRELIDIILACRRADARRERFAVAHANIAAALRFPHCLPGLPPWTHFGMRVRRTLHHTWAVGPELVQVVHVHGRRHITRRTASGDMVYRIETS